MFIEPMPPHFPIKLRRSGMCDRGPTGTAPAMHTRTCRSYGAGVCFRWQRTINMALLTELLYAVRFNALTLLTLLSLLTTARAHWRPAEAPLQTRWAADVNPTNVHAEYPRPQLVRADWLNLNGLWDYAIRPL